MDRTSAARLRRLRHPPPTAHQSPGRLGLRAVSSRQMPSVCFDGSTVRILDAVLPWTIPLRAVSSRQTPSVCLDGSTVWTLDAVLPWTVPMRAVSSRQMPSVCLDGLTVRTLSAMDRTSAPRLRRLRHPPPTAHQSLGRLGLRAVSSRQMPSVCLDGSTVWTLDAVLPWTVPMRAVSSRQMPTPWTVPLRLGYVVCATRRPPVTWALGSARRVLPSDAQCVPRWVDSPDFGRRVAMDHTSARRVLPSDAQCVPRWVDSPDFGRRVVWTVPLRAVSSRQMPSVCFDGSTVRTLDALFVITNSDPGTIDVADDTRVWVDAAIPLRCQTVDTSHTWSPRSIEASKHLLHTPHAKIYGILAIPTLRVTYDDPFYHPIEYGPTDKDMIDREIGNARRLLTPHALACCSVFCRLLDIGGLSSGPPELTRTHALARESQFSFLLFGFETPKNSHLDSYYENVLRDNLYNAASDDAAEIEDPMKPALDRVTEAVIASLSGEARAFYDRELGIGISTISFVTRLGIEPFFARNRLSTVTESYTEDHLVHRDVVSSKSATRSTRRKVYLEVGGVWYLGYVVCTTCRPPVT
ncbi:hypothetical protein B0H14DRAFT_3485297 [Mycena olivaceomarginata]|nr:hypothetical protein B0H14DRAFT_3485297 [Mycena olivaceomarginata]